MIFAFAVRRLRWLIRIPLFPQLFDALLLMGTAISNREKLRAIEYLERAVCAELGATIGRHRLGGTGFWLHRREIGHVHGNALVDVYVGDSHRAAALSGGIAVPHHLFRNSGWVSLWMRNEQDVAEALRLMTLTPR